MVIATSRNRRSATNNSAVIAMKDSTPASMNAPTMARPAARKPGAAPVASGARASPASTKRLSWALSLGSPRGTTDSRARPSGASQSRTRSGGSVARVILCGCSESRIWDSTSVSPGISRLAAALRAGSSALESARNSLASRRASAAAGVSAVATRSRSAAVSSRLATTWASEGGGATAIGLRARSRRLSVSAMIAIFAA